MRFNVYQELGDPFDKILGCICEKEIRQADYFKNNVLELVRFLNYCYYDEVNNKPFEMEVIKMGQKITQKTFCVKAQDGQRCVVAVLHNNESGTVKVQCSRQEELEFSLSNNRTITRVQKLEQTMVFNKNREFAELLTTINGNTNRKVYNLSRYQHEDLLVATKE